MKVLEGPFLLLDLHLAALLANARDYRSLELEQPATSTLFSLSFKG